jgi:hypothetical protein
MYDTWIVALMKAHHLHVDMTKASIQSYDSRDPRPLLPGSFRRSKRSFQLSRPKASRTQPIAPEQADQSSAQALYHHATASCFGHSISRRAPVPAKRPTAAILEDLRRT